MERLLILNQLNEKCITLVSLYWGTYSKFWRFIFPLTLPGKSLCILPTWAPQNLGHTCTQAVGQLCDHKPPACCQFCRSSLWAAVTWVISAHSTITHYAIAAQPYIYIYTYIRYDTIWYLVEMRKVAMAVGTTSITVTDWKMVGNQFLGHPLLKIVTFIC
jgi:hypothetical protein